MALEDRSLGALRRDRRPFAVDAADRTGGEVAIILSALRSREIRLLTLTGPGGTGKTRLAVEAAANVQLDFTDGAFFVSLAAIRDSDLVASTIAHALGVRQRNEALAGALEDH